MRVSKPSVQRAAEAIGTPLAKAVTLPFRGAFGLARMGTSLVLRRHNPPPGSRPGTLDLAGAKPTRLAVLEYDRDGVRRLESPSLSELASDLATGEKLYWIDVQGFGNEHFIGELGTLLGLHPLTIEDIVHTPQRPKLDVFDEHLVIITRMLRPEGDQTVSEQLSVVLGKNWVATIQEDYGDVLDPVRQRLHHENGLMRSRPPDYLAYAIVDAVVDAYFAPVERIGAAVEELEADILTTSSKSTLGELASLRAPLLAMRRPLRPQVEVLRALSTLDHALVDEENRHFFRDPLENTLQIIDTIDSYRELITGLSNTYLTLVGQRTNEAMRVLTVVASIFIPLTFIAGIYGMNFEYMPELRYRYGYFVVLGAMGILAGGLIGFFISRGWLDRG